MIAVVALLLAAGVTVELEVKKPLYLVRGELRGAIEVRVTNGGPDPITLQHRDVHGLRFTPSATGEAAPAIVFHDCECGFELGANPPPAARTFTLKPSETHTLRFDDFTCDGGPFRAPAAGRYLLTYSVQEPGPPPRREPFDLKRCEAVVRERPPGPYQSSPQLLDLKARKK